MRYWKPQEIWQRNTNSSITTLNVCFQPMKVDGWSILAGKSPNTIKLFGATENPASRHSNNQLLLDVAVWASAPSVYTPLRVRAARACAHASLCAMDLTTSSSGGNVSVPLTPAFPIWWLRTSSQQRQLFNQPHARRTHKQSRARLHASDTSGGAQT